MNAQRTAAGMPPLGPDKFDEGDDPLRGRVLARLPPGQERPLPIDAYVCVSQRTPMSCPGPALVVRNKRIAPIPRTDLCFLWTETRHPKCRNRLHGWQCSHELNQDQKTSNKAASEPCTRTSLCLYVSFDVCYVSQALVRCSEVR